MNRSKDHASKKTFEVVMNVNKNLAFDIKKLTICCLECHAFYTFEEIKHKRNLIQ